MSGTGRLRTDDRAARRDAWAPPRVPGWWVAFGVLALLSVLALYPLVFVAQTAFKTEAGYAADPVGLPNPPTLEFLQRALDTGRVIDYSVNSLLVVGCAVALIVVVSSLAGFALARLHFPGRTILLIGIIGLMAVPAAVLMIPLFRTVGQLGLVNTYPGLILVYAALNLPFSIYLVASYVSGLPHEILEAAEVDGASLLRQLRSIVVPMSVPAIATIVTLNFLWLWNELLFGLLILQDPDMRTVTVGLASLQGQHTTPVPLLAAGLLLSLGPVLLVFLFSQRNLSRGLTTGAVR
jgi:ABC-type glycerol-3-phosphate transport system permease component